MLLEQRFIFYFLISETVNSLELERSVIDAQAAGAGRRALK